MNRYPRPGDFSKLVHPKKGNILEIKTYHLGDLNSILCRPLQPRLHLDQRLSHYVTLRKLHVKKMINLIALHEPSERLRSIFGGDPCNCSKLNTYPFCRIAVLQCDVSITFTTLIRERVREIKRFVDRGLYFSSRHLY